MLFHLEENKKKKQQKGKTTAEGQPNLQRSKTLVNLLFKKDRKDKSHSKSPSRHPDGGKLLFWLLVSASVPMQSKFNLRHWLFPFLRQRTQPSLQAAVLSQRVPCGGEGHQPPAAAWDPAVRGRHSQEAAESRWSVRCDEALSTGQFTPHYVCVVLSRLPKGLRVQYCFGEGPPKSWRCLTEADTIDGFGLSFMIKIKCHPLSGFVPPQHKTSQISVSRTTSCSEVIKPLQSWKLYVTFWEMWIFNGAVIKKTMKDAIIFKNQIYRMSNSFTCVCVCVWSELTLVPC